MRRFRPAEIPRQAMHSFVRWFLLRLAGYSVKIEGKLPDEPSLLAGYPHNEHINSITLPSKDIVYVAAADYWYTKILMQLAMSLALDTIPMVRGNRSKSNAAKELAQQAKVFENGKHLMVFPQGSRIGAAKDVLDLREQIKPGIAFLARQHNRQTVPIGLVYPPDYQPKKGEMSAWKNLHQRMRGNGRSSVEIKVRIGEPIDPPEDSSRAAKNMFLSTLARELFNLAH